MASIVQILSLFALLFMGMVSSANNNLIYNIITSASIKFRTNFISISLPSSTGTPFTHALVTFVAGSPYATGTNFPSCQFYVNGDSFATTYGTSIFSYDYQNPTAPGYAFGRVPTSVQVLIPLTSSSFNVHASVEGIRDSNCVIDSTTTLSALLLTSDEFAFVKRDNAVDSIVSNTPTNIPGMSLSLDPLSNYLTTLTIGTPYATGNNQPGCMFNVESAGTSPFGTFTYNEANPPVTGRIPLSLQTLVISSSSVQAKFSSLRGANCLLGGSYISLSAIKNKGNLLYSSVYSSSAIARTLVSGLSLNLPTASTNYNTALVTFTISNPYADGDNYAGCELYIYDTANLAATPLAAGYWTYSIKSAAQGRRPAILQFPVTLPSSGSKTVYAATSGVRGGVCRIDSLTTLTAVLARS